MGYKRKSPIPVTEGGTNATSLATTDGVIYYDGSKLATTSAGSSGQVLQSAGAGVAPAYSTATYPATTTVSQLLYSSSANVVGGLATANNGTLVTSATGVPSVLAGPGTTGNILQSNAAAAPSYSTATYPSTAGTSGKVLVSDGTNIVSSTPTFPNASATSGKFIRSDGTNWIASTPTLPTSAGTAGKILRSDGTNYVETTATFPATAGSSGNVLTSDGTNWSSAAPAAGGVTGPGSSTDRAIATWNGTGGTALFNNSTITIDSTGRLRNTAQPSFTAYKSSSSTNATGDGTTVTVICDTELADVGNNFNNSTGIFTAPITGNYLFTFCILLQSMNVSHQAEIYIVTTGNSYLMGNYPGIFTGNCPMSFSVVVPMTASDTATPQVIVANSTKTVSIFGSGTPTRTFFSGVLLC